MNIGDFHAGIRDMTWDNQTDNYKRVKYLDRITKLQKGFHSTFSLRISVWCINTVW